jgi:hypothetical protein
VGQNKQIRKLTQAQHEAVRLLRDAGIPYQRRLEEDYLLAVAVLEEVTWDPVEDLPEIMAMAVEWTGYDALEVKG